MVVIYRKEQTTADGEVSECKNNIHLNTLKCSELIKIIGV